MIQVVKLVKHYQEGEVTTPVIEGLDLTIGDGEFVAIVGPSGSGKSTLLNLIGCLDKPDSGEITIDGTIVSSLKNKEALSFRAEHLGFIFQDFNLIESFTVYENVEFPLSVILGEKNTRERVKEVLEAIGMLDQIDKYPDQLSGGQKQRVAVARALVVNPRIILADEPTANLDSVSAKKVIDLMKQMQEKFNTTFVFSTHDTKIMTEARRIVTLQDGRIMDDRSNG
ncbi:MAG: ABC transporter ATP-binding protein [Campylobacterales bacterium]|nr:ABC transporter ATP-binding protein [Campylobacterales bacterium]